MAPRNGFAAAALASGLMVAGMVPEAEARIAGYSPRDPRDTRPNGAQLGTWAQREREALYERQKLRKHNRERRGVTWLKWTIGWAPKRGRHQVTHTTHRDRAQLCAAHGVPNTGRQWRRLRKALARQERAS